MKKTLILFAIILFVFKVNGQITYDIKGGSKYKDKTIVFGLKTGINSSSFVYSDSHLNTLPKDFLLRADIGAYLELPISKFLSVSPQVLLSSKGSSTSYIYENEYDVSYTVKSRYISMRLPINIRIPVRALNNNEFNLFFAPCYNYLLGGTIALSQPGLPISDVNINLGSANMRSEDISIFFGGGYRFRINFTHLTLITKFELGYNMSITNNFSDMELNQSSTPTNIHSYNDVGERYNRNLEFNVSIGIPIRLGRSECTDFNHDFPTILDTRRIKKTYKNPL